MLTSRAPRRRQDLNPIEAPCAQAGRCGGCDGAYRASLVLRRAEDQRTDVHEARLAAAAVSGPQAPSAAEQVHAVHSRRKTQLADAQILPGVAELVRDLAHPASVHRDVHAAAE